MQDGPPFLRLEEALQSGGSTALINALLETLLEQKNYGALFNARIMRTRVNMGLPPLQVGAELDVPTARRNEYEQELVKAARETGALFLADGQIERAWTYCQAIGEPGPVADAIDKLDSNETPPERVMELAFYERVNQRKGFEMILKQRGVCSALTAFSQYQDSATRDHALGLLLDELTRELVRSLKRTIASVEGAEPETNSVRELIQNRDWLFEGMNQYVDSTHIAGILAHCRETNDREILSKGLQLAEYATRLGSMFQFRGEPPFEEIYAGHAAYMRALLGEGVDEAVAYFRQKVETSGEPRMCAELLVLLLLRLQRYGEALRVSTEFLDGEAGVHYPCPAAVQLCQLAGDSNRLSEIARTQDDPLLYAAALLMQE